MSLDEHGKKKTWLLTGFDTKMSSDAERQVRANLKATQNKPILSRQVLGAELNKIIISQTGSGVKPQFQFVGEKAKTAAYKVKDILEQKGYTFYNKVESDFLSIFERPQAQEILDGLLDIGNYIKEDYNAEILYNDIRQAEIDAFGIDGYYTKRYDATGGEVFVAFSPNQIKSTTNRGTFSKDSDNIYYHYSYNPENVNIENGVVDLTDAFEGTPTVEDVEGFIQDVIKAGDKFKTLSVDFFMDFATRKKSYK